MVTHPLEIRLAEAENCCKVFCVGIENQEKILDADILIGLPEIRKLNISIVTNKDKQDICLYPSGKKIGHRCEVNQITIGMTAAIEPSKLTVEDMIEEYSELFVERALTSLKCEPVRVVLEDKRPLKMKPVKLSPSRQGDLRKVLDAWLRDGIIEKSYSSYCCAAHFVPKKNGSLRLVNNYIPINAKVSKDNYPLPYIGEILLALEGKKVFSSLDLVEGFLQVPLHEKDRYILAITTTYGLFQFKRLPYGFVNSPGLFQRIMNEIFWDGLNRRCIVYIDDILVFGRDEQDHAKNLRWVLEKCAEFNIKLKKSKCKFSQSKAEFLGFEVSERGIEPCKGRFDKDLETRPKDEKELATILGKIGFYARFIQQFAKRVQPVRRLLKQKGDFKWPEHMRQEMIAIIEELDHVEPQRIPKCDEKLIAEISTGGETIEAYLCDTEGKAIGRTSAQLSEVESRYQPIEKVLLALIQLFKIYRQYVNLNTLCIRTGVKTFERTLNLKNKSERVERLLLRMPDISQCKIEFKEQLVDDTGKDSCELNQQRSISSNTDESCMRKLEDHFDAVLYSDGACKSNGKDNCRAARAYVATKPAAMVCQGKVEGPKASNQIAELRAAIEAINGARKLEKKKILLYTDSEYVEKAINEKINKWQRDGWRTHDNKALVNEKMLKELSEAMQGLKIYAKKVAAHSGVPENELADKLAKLELVALMNVEADHEIEEIRQRMEKDPVFAEKYVFKNDKLFHLVKDSDNELQEKQFIIKKLLLPLMSLAHEDDITGGHLRVRKTLRRIARSFYWPRMTDEIRKHVKTCDICQRFKCEKGKPSGKMHILSVTNVFDTVFIDVVGPIHKSAKGNVFIVTLVDGFTRFGIAKAYKQVLAETIVNFVVDNIVLIHGPIKLLICDNGSVFNSDVFRTAMSKLGIKISFTTPYHPQANGRVERWNGTLKSILKKYIDKTQNDWDIYLDRVINIYNNTNHEATNYTPYELLYGRASKSVFNQQQQLDIVFNDPDPTRLLARSKAANNIIESSKVTKYYYDQKHSVNEYKEGDEILVRSRTRLDGLSRKLAHQWEGPFILKRLIGDKENPKLALFIDGEEVLHRVAFEHIKPYYNRDEEEREELKQLFEADNDRNQDDMGNSQETDIEEQILQAIKFGELYRKRKTSKENSNETINVDVETATGQIPFIMNNKYVNNWQDLDEQQLVDSEQDAINQYLAMEEASRVQ